MVGYAIECQECIWFICCVEVSALAAEVWPVSDSRPSLYVHDFYRPSV